MSPGAEVKIVAHAQRFYRKAGTQTVGQLVLLSPSGAVALVRFDDIADSFVRVEHLETPQPQADQRLCRES